MHNDEDFYLVLPSNSSMKYFPDNTTTHFTTQLSREIALSGQWAVGLSEIHIPCTMIHLQPDETEIRWTPCDKKEQIIGHIPHGLYHSHAELMNNINNLPGMREAGIQLVNAKSAHGYAAIEGEKWVEKCGKQIVTPQNILCMNKKIARILGFNVIPNEDWETSEIVHLRYIRGIQREGQMPPCIARALPEQLFVYTDLCVPYTVGDTQTSLLRIVNLNTSQYTYGATQVKYFSPSNYIPLLNNCFRSIEIDIRDHLGKSIAFEYGTLTLTLHFKRVA